MDTQLETTSVPARQRIESLRSQMSELNDSALFISGADADERFCVDFSGGRGAPLAVLRPASPDHAARAVRAAHSLDLPIVIQGGMTGLVGAGVPQAGEVVLSLERLNLIEEIDEANLTMTVQAGVKLQEAQQAAEAVGLMLPIDIGSKGSCHVGGVVATNAGGNRVLRFGMARSSVLGMEVVLPDGSVIRHLGKVMKDNAGYDLKQLFIGSEGTLGVITRLVFALQPLPRSRQTALVSVQSFAQAVALLKHARHRLGPRLTSFEVMWRDFFDTVTTQLRIGRQPFAEPGSHLILLESMGQDPDADDERFNETLGDFLSVSEGADAVVARSLAEAAELWAIRESSGEAAAAVRPYVGFDISLPIGAMDDWVRQTHEGLAGIGIDKVQTYGHLGDGNLHLVAGYGSDQPDMKSRIYDLVHASVGALGGSVSGEHGIGFFKKSYLAMSRSDEEIALMRAIKRAIDPRALLNRGRVFDPA
ncbi:FAD-binding oxidoreductase [Variovorax sp. J22R133]|uniref:FAD-binding oxidoreductase n=1 Tax=Variovorax brevis TaxID=3053503 RepID=UPI0025760DD7|nr:FAD-binding oxidoreductase [Variovorax sp. J22R133]MDM0116931.1 FAD-binding oxidoreductase [Variovorax sp. J22R133]